MNPEFAKLVLKVAGMEVVESISMEILGVEEECAPYRYYRYGNAVKRV